MSALEITETALQRGILETRGKTPEATLNAALYLEARAACPQVRRVCSPGPIRARRNTVRWLLVGPVTRDKSGR
jgi:hypothetical protein